jgi:hypothetical protein
MIGSGSPALLGRKATHNYLILHFIATFESHIYSEFRLEVVSQLQITPAGKAQGDLKAQYTRAFREACNAAIGSQTGLLNHF